MIRYPITEADLLSRISQKNSHWLRRAALITSIHATAGKYTSKRDFWGAIKQVYIDLQYEKCAYCETKLQGSVLASKVHEVEHYRPKSSVKRWPNYSVSHWKNFKHTWQTGSASSVGYYLLAYQPLNYAIACTRCNSTLKSNYFPIRGRRNLSATHPNLMAREDALLLYPVSDIDPDDPEDIITFDGPLAVAKFKSGPRYERAETNIAFFQLNHEDLTLRRCEMLHDLWIALNTRAVTPDEIQERQLSIDLKCKRYGQFSACAKAFRVLFHTDRAKATEYKKLIAKALNEWHASET